MRRTAVGLSLAALAAAFLALSAVPGSAEEMGAPDAQKLWSHLQKVDYEEWSTFADKPEGFYEGQEPHRLKLKLYANRKAAGNAGDPPHGAILVKENYTPDEKLLAITVMQRVEGYDPTHRDWFSVKYQPDGTVAMQDGTSLAGKVQGCIGCHGKAAGNDYVFSNDG